MYHYRQALVRMRLGDSDRQIAKTGLTGRRVAGALRSEAAARGWLDTHQPLPPDDELAAVLELPKKQRAQHSSSLEPHRDQITLWFEDGCAGHHHSQCAETSPRLRRKLLCGASFYAEPGTDDPAGDQRAEFAPGDAAQVDFGQGPRITDVYTGEQFKTWFFIMTLAWSRHQYAELVRDQSVETWLRMSSARL